MLHQIWSFPGTKLHYPHFCPTIVLKTYIMKMNLVFFNIYQINPFNWDQKSLQEENISRLESLVWQPLILLVFVIGKAKNPPRCFKNILTLPSRYRPLKNCWMGSIIWKVVEKLTHPKKIKWTKWMMLTTHLKSWTKVWRNCKRKIHLLYLRTWQFI